MSVASIITSYTEHNRGLGKRFRSEAFVLLAFARSVGDTPLQKDPARYDFAVRRLQGQPQHRQAQEVPCAVTLLPLRGRAWSTEGVTGSGHRMEPLHLWLREERNRLTALQL